MRRSDRDCDHGPLARRLSCAEVLQIRFDVWIVLISPLIKRAKNEKTITKIKILTKLHEDIVVAADDNHIDQRPKTNQT